LSNIYEQCQHEKTVSRSKPQAVASANLKAVPVAAKRAVAGVVSLVEFTAKAPRRGMRYEIFGSLDPATVREKIVQRQIGMNLVVRVVHDAIGLDAKEMATIFDVKASTIEKRAAEAKPLEKATHGDRAWRLARIYDFAVEMIGDPDKAARWLRAPNRFMQGRTPIEMLETEVSTQAVEQSLAAIGYGQVG
jgi:putative toxin-antitoxin system antitoxin component (TIGR02293 family)